MEGFNRGGGRGGFGGGRGGFGGGRGGGFRRSFNDGPREMHKATCSECKKECEVPFKPTEGKPVYCKECYFKRKDSQDGAAPRSPRREQPQDDSGSENF
jgi:CxxC-x17-CxxC domain-containing protein